MVRNDVDGGQQGRRSLKTAPDVSGSGWHDLNGNTAWFSKGRASSGDATHSTLARYIRIKIAGQSIVAVGVLVDVAVSVLKFIAGQRLLRHRGSKVREHFRCRI